jgi:hypothetical protein
MLKAGLSTFESSTVNRFRAMCYRSFRPPDRLTSVARLAARGGGGGKRQHRGGMGDPILGWLSADWSDNLSGF